MDSDRNVTITEGCVCECQHEKMGVVTRIYTIGMGGNPNYKKIYEGIGFDGKAWQSQNPKFIAENLEQYVDRLVTGVKNVFDHHP